MYIDIDMHVCTAAIYYIYIYVHIIHVYVIYMCVYCIQCDLRDGRFRKLTFVICLYALHLMFISLFFIYSVFNKNVHTRACSIYIFFILSASPDSVYYCIICSTAVGGFFFYPDPVPRVHWCDVIQNICSRCEPVQQRIHKWTATTRRRYNILFDDKQI